MFQTTTCKRAPCDSARPPESDIAQTVWRPWLEGLDGLTVSMPNAEALWQHQGLGAWLVGKTVEAAAVAAAGAVVVSTKRQAQPCRMW